MVTVNLKWIKMLKKYILPDDFDKAKIETIKDSLENLSLYLSEIEKIINIPSDEVSDENKSYKLHMLEKHIAETESLIKLISGEDKNKNIILS